MASPVPCPAQLHRNAVVRVRARVRVWWGVLCSLKRQVADVLECRGRERPKNSLFPSLLSQPRHLPLLSSSESEEIWRGMAGPLSHTRTPSPPNLPICLPPPSLPLSQIG